MVDDSTNGGGALTAEGLKARFTRERDASPQAVNLRVYRAISWLDRAERDADDPDAAFIFYWIALNAAYAREQGAYSVGDGAGATSERGSFREFFDMILRFDAEGRVYGEIWDRFSGPIRILLDNQYVFQPFWDHQQGNPDAAQWEARFRAAKVRANQALVEQDTVTVLAIVFDRLYTLRNQLIHGGATWQSSVNRDQVRDGARILSFLVPLFISIMMDNPDGNWGEPSYPPIGDSD